MKVLVIGATGLVGSSLLDHILTSPSEVDITHVFTLTRSPLSETYASNPKVTSIIHHDFLQYPPELLDRLSAEGVQACLWCIGGRHTQTSRWKDDAEYVRCSVDFTVKAAEAFLQMSRNRSKALEEKRSFRFVFCSGDSTEMDQDKTLWIMERTRKVKGMAETALFRIADSSDGIFEAYTVRPCGVIQPQANLKDWLLTTFVLPSCRIEALAAVMVQLAKSGGEERIITHPMINEQGESLLKNESVES